MPEYFSPYHSTCRGFGVSVRPPSPIPLSHLAAPRVTRCPGCYLSAAARHVILWLVPEDSTARHASCWLLPQVSAACSSFVSLVLLGGGAACQAGGGQTGMRARGVTAAPAGSQRHFLVKVRALCRDSCTSNENRQGGPAPTARQTSSTKGRSHGSTHYLYLGALRVGALGDKHPLVKAIHSPTYKQYQYVSPSKTNCGPKGSLGAVPEPRAGIPAQSN